MGSMGQMTDPAAWLGMITSGWNDMGQTAFWVALLKIMWINILLSGDNAVVIAMACRGSPIASGCGAWSWARVSQSCCASSSPASWLR